MVSVALSALQRAQRRAQGELLAAEDDITDADALATEHYEDGHRDDARALELKARINQCAERWQHARAQLSAVDQAIAALAAP